MEGAPLRRYGLVFLALILLLLLVFALVRLADVALLTDPAPWLGRGGPGAAGVGVSLLIADVILPVPSSLLMVAHGALFGVVLGAALSLVGGLGAAALAFALGRRGTALLQRLITPAEKSRADQLLERWGFLAIVVTRPIPLLAETTALMAGASRMPWPSMLGASALGLLPACALYALAGATSHGGSAGLMVFALVMVFAGIIWWRAR